MSFSRRPWAVAPGSKPPWPGSMMMVSTAGGFIRRSSGDPGGGGKPIVVRGADADPPGDDPSGEEVGEEPTGGSAEKKSLEKPRAARATRGAPNCPSRASSSGKSPARIHHSSSITPSVQEIACRSGPRYTVVIGRLWLVERANSLQCNRHRRPCSQC